MGGHGSAVPFPEDKTQSGQSQRLSQASTPCSRGEGTARGLKAPPPCPPLPSFPTGTGGTYHGPGFPQGFLAPKRFGEITGFPFACGTLPGRVNPVPPSALPKQFIINPGAPTTATGGVKPERSGLRKVVGAASFLWPLGSSLPGLSAGPIGAQRKRTAPGGIEGVAKLISTVVSG